MPVENQKYYEKILEEHERIREEQGEEHPTAIRLRELAGGAVVGGGGEGGGDGGATEAVEGSGVSSPKGRGGRGRRGGSKGSRVQLQQSADKANLEAAADAAGTGSDFANEQDRAVVPATQSQQVQAEASQSGRSTRSRPSSVAIEIRLFDSEDLLPARCVPRFPPASPSHPHCRC